MLVDWIKSLGEEIVDMAVSVLVWTNSVSIESK